MPAAGAESAGFWFFACTALMLVAVLAFALGRARGAARRDRSAGAGTGPSRTIAR
jgi:hypothetical protein